MESTASTSEVPPVGTPPQAGSGLSAEDRRLTRRCLSVLGVLSTGTLIGVVFSLYLVGHYPLLLIAISPIWRHLIVVAPTVHPVAFVLVAVSRRMAFAIACFYLGRALGPTAIDWLEARAPRAARFYRWLDRVFKRASHLVVFLMPGPGVSALAGSAGMRAPVFGLLIALGLSLRMVIVVALGDYFREPIEVLLGLINDYWIPGTILLVLAVALYRWRSGGFGLPFST